MSLRDKLNGGQMSYLFPSDEWIKELQRICNDDPEFSDSCRKFSAKMAYQIDTEPGKLESPVIMYFWPDNGRVFDARALSSLEEVPDTEYVISGKYSVWKEVSSGGLDPFRAIITKKLKLVKGSQLKLMKNVKEAMKIMNLCITIDSRYPDDSS